MSKGISIAIFIFWYCCWSVCRDGVEGSHDIFLHLQSLQPPNVGQKYRTKFHFQPPKNWMNDPNGPMYYNGIYHFFYQYNPKGAVWGNIVWAHSVSTDLINWIPLEPPIYPSKDFDINGCWSGSATILPNKKVVMLYTGIDTSEHQVQVMAIPKNLSDPYLREWMKPDYNPIIVATEGVNGSAFRDPTTAWSTPDGHWKLLIGSRRGRRGTAILYRSRDFLHWVKAKHLLHSSPHTGMWECPDLYPVLGGNKTKGSENYYTREKGKKYVLKNSLDENRIDYYTIGQYDYHKDRYVPDPGMADNRTGLRYDYGKFYASKSFYDPAKKRRVLWGWVNESSSVEDDVAKGWAGIQAIPRKVWLSKNGRQVIQWPVKELESLRGKEVQWSNKVLKKGASVEVTEITAAQADVDFEFEIESLDEAEDFDPSWTDPRILCEKKGANVKGKIGPFGLNILASKGMEEYTAVFFRVFKAEKKHVVLMCSDQSRSSLQTDVDKATYGGFVDVRIDNKKIFLRSLIDHSVIESFGGGGRTCITARVYPNMAVGNQAHLYAFNKGSETVKVLKMKGWSMKSAKIA